MRKAAIAAAIAAYIALCAYAALTAFPIIIP